MCSSDLEGEIERLEGLLVQISRHYSMRDPLIGSFERIGLTGAQLHALMWLGHDGSLTMGELARRCGITEKTVTGLVDRLERAGLSRRERDEKDRRLVRACITDEGTRIFDDFHAHLHERLSHFLELLDESERKAAMSILVKVLDQLARGAFQPAQKEQP